MANVIWGTTTKPVSSQRLAEIIQASQDTDGTLYIGYPVLGTPDGAFPFDGILLSPQHGIIIFDIVEGRDLGDYEGRQDNFFSKLQSKLIQYPALVQRRILLANIVVLTFAPVAAISTVSSSDYPVYSDERVIGFISSIDWAHPEVFPALAAAVQALSNIKKGRRRRDIQQPDSRGAKLQRLNRLNRQSRRGPRSSCNRNG